MVEHLAVGRALVHDLPECAPVALRRCLRRASSRRPSSLGPPSRVRVRLRLRLRFRVRVRVRVRLRLRLRLRVKVRVKVSVRARAWVRVRARVRLRQLSRVSHMANQYWWAY